MLSIIQTTESNDMFIEENGTRKDVEGIGCGM
jgi:hypothetical protein